MARGGGRRGGRIRPHQRSTDNATDIIDDESFQYQHGHDEAIQETESAARSDKVKADYCNRSKEMVDWVRVKYPDYYRSGVVAITEEERNDPRLYYHKMTHKLVLRGINVKIVKAFLSEKKVKVTGSNNEIAKYNSFSHLRKYDDAIKFMAEQEDINLSEEYYTQMDNWLKAYKKGGWSTKSTTSENA